MTRRRRPRQWRGLAPLLALALIVTTAVPAGANPASAALRREGYRHVFNLDHDEALASFRQAIEADPKDPAAYRAMAVVSWLNLLYTRGSVSADDYLGATATTQPNVRAQAAPRALVEAFRVNIGKALELAEAQLQARPNDVEAHFNVGATVGQLAAFTATVDARLFTAFRLARRAFDEHEQVLELDPRRKDAGLIVGTYRYVVANLAVMMRWMAYLAGFGGGRERGTQMLEECAAYPSDVQNDARLALLIIYNRERRFDDALRVLAVMRREFPRNRLLWLESGAAELRAGKPDRALDELSAGLAMFGRDPRPKAFGEAALWHYKRGAALVALGRRSEADADLQIAVRSEGRVWVRGRAHTELGKLADLAGNRAAARASYQKAIALGREDNDPAGVLEAEKLVDRAYRGTNVTGARQ